MKTISSAAPPSRHHMAQKLLCLQDWFLYQRLQYKLKLWCFITRISHLIRKRRGKLSRTPGEMLLLTDFCKFNQVQPCKASSQSHDLCGQITCYLNFITCQQPFATSSYVATDTGGFGYTSPHPCVMFTPPCFPSFSSPTVATKEWFKYKRKRSQGLSQEQSTFCGLMKDETNHRIIIAEKYRQQPWDKFT